MCLVRRPTGADVPGMKRTLTASFAITTLLTLCLAVMSRHVVYAADGRAADGGVVAVMVVGVEPVGKSVDSFFF